MKKHIDLDPGPASHDYMSLQKNRYIDTSVFGTVFAAFLPLKCLVKASCLNWCLAVS